MWFSCCLTCKGTQVQICLNKLTIIIIIIIVIIVVN